MLPESGHGTDTAALLGLDATMLVAALKAAGHDETLPVDLAIFDDRGSPHHPVGAVDPRRPVRLDDRLGDPRRGDGRDRPCAAGVPRAAPHAFDTSIVDLTDITDDPVEVLMSVQLDGGTHIARALAYAASRIERPTRSIVVLITDFGEGGSAAEPIATVERLCGAGVRVLGLAALDPDVTPVHDHRIAEECASAGAEIAALTPDRLAAWIGGILD